MPIGPIGPHTIGDFRQLRRGSNADLDSPAYASHWGGLPEGFAGVVVNLRAKDRAAVDSAFERALTLGAVGFELLTTRSGELATPSCAARALLSSGS